jgi:predicted DNA-binding helix-hairpin-helix protein
MKRAVESCDRVGINIEFPLPCYYDEMKIYLDFKQDVLRKLRQLARCVVKAKKEGKCKAGLDTQFIVGAVEESDKEIIKVTEWLYKDLHASRVYYSAFQPVHGTPLEGRLAESKLREYRLYQSSFLIQRYGFHLKDFIFDDRDRLPLSWDPKVLSARQKELLVNLEDATLQEMLRVPGIGIVTAQRLIKLREERKLTTLELKRAGVLRRALPFIELKGYQTTLMNF